MRSLTITLAVIALSLASYSEAFCQLDDATKSNIQRASGQRINVIDLSPTAKLGRVKSLTKAQLPSLPPAQVESAKLLSPTKFTLVNGKSVQSIGQLFFMGGILGVTPNDETVGLEKYVPGAANKPVMLFQFTPTTPGIYIFDVAMDSAFKSTGNVHLSIDGSGVKDTQTLPSDGHVLFLVNLKSVSPTGNYFFLYCDNTWTFKSLEVSQFK